MTALFVAFATVIVAAPAMAAPVYEITARWADGTAAEVGSGDVLSSEWRINVNDDAAAPSNEPVDNVTFTVTAANGRLATLPDLCLTTGVDPASSIAADGATLLCNIGTQEQGTAAVVMVPVTVDGATGDEVSLSGSISGQSAQVDPVPILNRFGMDMRWGATNSALTYGTGYVDVPIQWTLSTNTASDPGPNTVTYDLTYVAQNGSVTAVAPTGCSAFDGTPAAGHPWSAGNHPDDHVAPFVESCTLTKTGANTYRLTLTGIDYSRTQVPTIDSNERALPTDQQVVASGQVIFRVNTTTTTGTTLTSNAPTYTAPTGQTAQDDPANNSSSKTATFGSGWSSVFNRGAPYMNTGGTPWDDTIRVSPGHPIHQQANGSVASTAANGTYGTCSVLDTRYVDYLSGSWKVPALVDWKFPVGGVLEWYVGNDATVDPASGSYNPANFDCGLTSGWTTTEPTDPSTVKAMRLTFPGTGNAGPYGVFIQGRLQDDVPTGQDVWQFGNAMRNGVWTANMAGGGGQITPTPDARYPGTSAYRDILRVVVATPAVLKSVDRAVVRPGVPATFTLTYSANGTGPIPPTVDGFGLVDTLPLGMNYVAGSATPEPAITTDPSGRQVLTWTLDDVPTNAQHALTYQAVPDSSVVPGSVLQNSVTASLGLVTSLPRTAQVTVSTSGTTSIAKTTDQWFIANPNGSGDGEGSWTVTLRSQDPLPQAFTDTIDLLPYNGDDRGSVFAGTYDVTSVDAPAGATVYYTTADPASLTDDPSDPSNGSAGDVSGNTVGWSTTPVPNPTAIRVIGGVLAPGATFAFGVNIATDGGEPGDVYMNRAQAISEHTELVTRTSEPLTMGAQYSASLKKYVQDADGEWRDANDVADYPSFSVGDTVRYRIVVTNTGQGTLTDIAVRDDKQPQLGSFVIDELAPGAEEAHEFEIELGAGGLDTVVNTACAAAAQPSDSEAAPTIICDPAGFEVEGEPTHTKSIVSAAPIGDGQWEIVYALEVTNTSTAPTSYSLADELHFTDQVDIVSAAVTGSPDGVTLADPAWDGQGNLDVATEVPLLGSDDAGYAPHTYLLTVVADVPLQFTPGGALPATACAADGEDTDTAFNNTSALTLPNGDVEPDQACATPPSIDITKSVSSGPTPNGDGTWTVTYDVVATNDGGAAGVYDISDRMTANGDLEVVSGSVVTAPDGVTPSATWTGLGAEGSAENVIASEVSLPAGATHTYQVEVVIGLAEGTEGAPVITDCAAEPGENGGLSNTAEVEHNDLTDDASACITVGVVTVDKSVSSGPTPNGDGTWTVVYDIVATQVGAADADYDVTDRLHFGEGIEIVEAAVTTAPDGVETNADWTGRGAEDSDAENLIAEGITLSVGETHTYQVEVTVQMDEATIDPANLQCAPAGSGEAGGLGNSTTLTSNGITGEDTVCPELPLIELDKQVVDGSPVENGDGMWTITYDVTATNRGAAEGDYDISDRLRYGDGIDVESATVISAPTGVETNTDWTGQGAEGADENVIATDVTLAAGTTHTYRVVVIASMDQETVTPGDLVCPAPGTNATGGFSNTAGLVHNGEPQDAEACVSPPLIEITKSLSGAVTPVEGEDGVYDATYELTVTNSGAGAGVYDLDDQLAPGEGITIVGVQEVTTDVVGGVTLNGGFNGVDDVRIVTGQAIAGADGAPVVHTYMVTVRYAADLAGIDVPTGDVCTAEGGESLPGTLNNTATVGWNGLDGSDIECIRPGDPTLDKALVSATPVGDGQWEVVYNLTVGNTGTEATTYDLDDELLFAPQITVDSITATGGPEGVVINDGFDGDADQRIATDVEIIGLDDEGYTPHVYTVTVIANVPLSFDAGDVEDDGTASPACTVPAGGNFVNQGLNNAATLTDETGGTVTDTDCAGVPSIDIVKTMDGDPVKGANGRWTVNYTITVENDGAAAGEYTLTDQLRYGTGIEVLSATVTAPEGITPAATWTGLGEKGADENVVAPDVALAVGTVHVYHVVVEARLNTDAADATAITCPTPGSGDRGGFANTAGVDHNDLTDESAVCAVPEWPEEVPPPLAITGGTIGLGVLGTGLLLLVAGGILLHLRRRRATENAEPELIG